jgi:hypothetical protein
MILARIRKLQMHRGPSSPREFRHFEDTVPPDPIDITRTATSQSTGGHSPQENESSPRSSQTRIRSRLSETSAQTSSKSLLTLRGKFACDSTSEEACPSSFDQLAVEWSCATDTLRLRALHVTPRSTEIQSFYDPTNGPAFRGGFMSVWKDQCQERDVVVRVFTILPREDAKQLKRVRCWEYCRQFTLTVARTGFAESLWRARVS